MNLIMTVVCAVFAFISGTVVGSLWRAKHALLSVLFVLLSFSLAIYTLYFATEQRHEELARVGNAFNLLGMFLLTGALLLNALNHLYHRRWLSGTTGVSFAGGVTIFVFEAIDVLPQWTMFAGLGCLVMALCMSYLADASKRRTAMVKVARAPSHLATSPTAIISSQDDELLARIHEAEQRPQRVIEG